MRLFRQTAPNELLAVPCGSPVRDQRVARHLQFLERALRGRRRLGRPQMQRCPHLRQHPRVYGVGLGALSHRLRKTPRLQRIGARQRQARLQERLLEGAVPRSGGLVHDRADRLVDPRDQCVESRRVIGESRGLAGGSHVGVEMRLRNVNAYGRIWHLFLLLCLFFEPSRSCIHSGRRKRRWRPNSVPARCCQAARGPTTATPGAPNRGARGWTFRSRSTAVKLTNKRRGCSCGKSGSVFEAGPATAIPHGRPQQSPKRPKRSGGLRSG